ncbi:DUF998 domain-containing protein [Phytoactinopolyspora mesophila]|uniref:DUF998 domain-containing protein n=1 Tax=Phytoactinopolyspora mesophila TaxID=2650750 RepID=A0A7K3LYC9_9ACTN|nr:DUF998 domain-containing protein [Phytoactinopolyspora mesophila]
MVNRRPPSIRLLGAAGIAGVAFFAATGLLMHAVQPELNPLERLGSDYVHGRLGWIFVVGFLVIGAGLGAFAVAVHRLGTNGGRRLLASSALGVSGAAFVVTGLFETDPLGPDGLPMRTMTGHVHNAGSFVAFAGVIIAAAALSRQLPRVPGWERRGRVTRVFTWVMAVALIGTAIAGPGAFLAGLVQRVFVAILLTWLVLLGVWLWRGPASSVADATNDTDVMSGADMTNEAGLADLPGEDEQR